MTRAAQSDRMLVSAMADLRPFDQEPDEHGYQRHRSVELARQHLAGLSPERRAMLQAEWNAK